MLHIVSSLLKARRIEVAVMLIQVHRKGSKGSAHGSRGGSQK